MLYVHDMQVNEWKCEYYRYGKGCSVVYAVASCACSADDRKPNRSFSHSDQVNTGIGCASVLKTHLSKGISSSSVKSRYAYFNLFNTDKRIVSKAFKFGMRVTRDVRFGKEEAVSVQRIKCEKL